MDEVCHESCCLLDPDLSMEFTEYLKMAFHRLDASLAAETKHIDVNARGHERYASLLCMRYALDAAEGSMIMLIRFSPDITNAKLSDDIHRIIHSNVVIGRLTATFKNALREHVPRDRRKWLVDDIDGHIFLKRLRLRTSSVLDMAMNERTQAVAISAGSGALVMSYLGGSLGFCAGSTLGVITGLPLAVVTFGVSVPTSMILGGTLGTSAGAVGGGIVGFIGGGAAGNAAYSHREDLGQMVLFTDKNSAKRWELAPERVVEFANNCRDYVVATTDVARGLLESARLKTETSVDTSDPKFRAASAGAVGGAAIVGAGGGGAGLVTGGLVGAVCGVAQAPFTFGLSIPVGVVIGSSAGLCLGTATGGAAGAIGGGAAGYSGYCAYARKGEFLSNSRSCVFFVTERGKASAQFVRGNLLGGTGGTAD